MGITAELFEISDSAALEGVDPTELVSDLFEQGTRWSLCPKDGGGTWWADFGGTSKYSERSTGLDKAWHAIHFTLCRTTEPTDSPLSFLMGYGGLDLSEEWDIRLLTSEEVKRVADALQAIALEEFTSRIDLDATEAAGVYPGQWTRDGIQSIDYIASYYEAVRSFLGQASSRGNSVVIAVQ